MISGLRSSNRVFARKLAATVPVSYTSGTGSAACRFSRLFGIKNEPFNPMTTRTSYRHYSYNYSSPYAPPPTPRYKKVLTGLGVVTGVLALAFYLYWPKHTFPSPVAKILRRGLWAESDRGEEDFELALKHYIEALQKCDELGMDRLSDEYTGIQLKIGEMYERLNLIDEANFVYNEIATLYLKVLTDPKSQIPETLRTHFIQKDLRVIIKLVELNKQNMNLCRAILVTHSVIAGSMIESRLGQPLASLQVEDVEELKKEGTSPVKYLPFLDEYINVMDLLIAINISLGDYGYSINLNLDLNKLMLLIDYNRDKILLNQCNLGSLLYLQSEMFEMKLIEIFKANGIDYKDSQLDYKKYLENEQHSALLSPRDSANYAVFYNNYTNCINLAVDAYENVGKIGKHILKHRTDSVTAEPDPNDPVAEEVIKIHELIALSTYSLGVINLHLKNYTKSERLLRESRVLSRNCKYYELVNEIEAELTKLFNEKKALESA